MNLNVDDLLDLTDTLEVLAKQCLDIDNDTAQKWDIRRLLIDAAACIRGAANQLSDLGEFVLNPEDNWWITHQGCKMGESMVVPALSEGENSDRFYCSCGSWVSNPPVVVYSDGPSYLNGNVGISADPDWKWAWCSSCGANKPVDAFDICLLCGTWTSDAEA